MALSPKDQRINRADDILQLTFQAIVAMERRGKHHDIKNTEDPAFWIIELERQKQKLDREIGEARAQIKTYKVLPKSLTSSFETACKRKAVIKGRFTKIQNHLKSRIS